MKSVKFRKEWLFYGAAVAALVFSTTSITSSQPKAQRLEPAGVINAPPFADSIAATGIVEPASETITVAPDIDGVIKAVHVAPGDKVRAGTPLFSLDNRRQFAAVQKAQAQLERAGADLALRKAEAQSAAAHAEAVRIGAARLRTSVERYAPLRNDDAISAEDFDDMAAEAEKAARPRSATARRNDRQAPRPSRAAPPRGSPA